MKILFIYAALDDNFNTHGCEDDSDQSADQVDEVFLELERRSYACNGGYPFELQMHGTVLAHLSEMDESAAIAYRFLLMATRLNMKTGKIHANIDGTELMEELVSSIMRNYLGAGRAESYVFGTSASGGFSTHVENLCRALGEGGGYKPADPGRVRAMDAKIDAVSWIPFADRNPGKLVVFTQCKTGTSWRGFLGDLHPEAFMKTWTRDRALNCPRSGHSAYPRLLIAADGSKPALKGDCFLIAAVLLILRTLLIPLFVND